jgi:DNA (cytosine-5)-methyltransferase 1
VSGLVLSLFPGIGLLDMAFEQEGFCVVRGPDLLWGGDVRRFHPPPYRFDGIIGGPPCQRFSRLQSLVAAQRRKSPDKYQKAPNLIPEFERCIRKASPRWFVMENVPAAPEPEVDRYLVRSQLLNNRWLGERQNRLRRFSWGWRLDSGSRVPRLQLDDDIVALENPEYAPAVLASGGGRCVPVALGGSGKRKTTHGKISKAADLGRCSTEAFREMCELQGLPSDYDLPGFTVKEKIRAVGNGVPIPMGRAVARAVKRALEEAR